MTAAHQRKLTQSLTNSSLYFITGILFKLSKYSNAWTIRMSPPILIPDVVNVLVRFLFLVLFQCWIFVFVSHCTFFILPAPFLHLYWCVPYIKQRIQRIACKHLKLCVYTKLQTFEALYLKLRHHSDLDFFCELPSIRLTRKCVKFITRII